MIPWSKSVCDVPEVHVQRQDLEFLALAAYSGRRVASDDDLLDLVILVWVRLKKDS
jgi:hypothetical protein